MWKTAVIVVLVALATVGSAHADWEFTRWGMSPQEVAAASKGAAPMSAGEPGMRIEGYAIGNVGTYRHDGYEFRSVFYYRDGALRLIKLELQSGDRGCRGLESDLRKKYGEPISEDHTPPMDIWTWRDAKNNDHISLLNLVGLCSLQYRPLEDVEPGQGDVKTDSGPDARCAQLAELAESIMRARQRGVPLARQMEIARENGIDARRSIIIMAYEEPHYSTPSIQERVIGDFRDEIHLACLKAAQKSDR